MSLVILNALFLEVADADLNAWCALSKIHLCRQYLNRYVQFKMNL